MNFANPEYLWLLLLLPVVAALFLLAQELKKRSIARFGQSNVVQALMPEQSVYKPWIRLAITLLLIAVVVIMLARPRGGATQVQGTLKGCEVMICLDVSNSMNSAANNETATDVSRLQRAKLVLEKLIDRVTGNKVGLIVFAGNAYMQMPLTADAQGAKMYLNAINTDMVPTQGTAIGAAIGMAQQSFSAQKCAKTIIIITDGENFEDDAKDAAKTAKKAGIIVNVVGIGSTEKTPVQNAYGEVIYDENGQPAMTCLDEESAQKIAAAGGGSYVWGGDRDAVNDIYEALQKLPKNNLGTYNYAKHDEQFPVLAWIALLLLIADILLLDRKNPWLKKYNFFTKNRKK